MTVSTIPALQRRSRETQRRLFEAAEALFVERGAADTSVAEIADRAGVGIGTFYGRFRDKEAFLAAFCERYFESGPGRADALFASDKWPADSVAAAVRGFVVYRVEHYQRNRRLLGAVVAHLRTAQSHALRALATQFASHFHEQVVELMQRQPDAGQYDVGPRRIALGLTLVEAVLKDVYLYEGGRLVSPPIDSEDLVGTLTRTFIDCLER